MEARKLPRRTALQAIKHLQELAWERIGKEELLLRLLLRRLQTMEGESAKS